MKLRSLLCSIALIYSLGAGSAFATITFTGGSYWAKGWSQHTPYLTAVSYYAANSITSVYPTTPINTGDTIQPGVDSNGNNIYQALLGISGDGDKYHAQIREQSIREYRWALRVVFTAPDTSGNGKAHFTMPGFHRHSIKVGDDQFNSGFTVSYTVDSNNKVSYTMPWGATVTGVFTTDHQTLIMSDTGDGLGLTTAVKVAAGTTTLANDHYLFNGYMLEINRNDTTYTDGENGNEQLTAYFSASLGWLDLASSPGNFTMSTIDSRLTIDNPESTSPTVSTTNDDEKMTDLKSVVIGAFMDGAGPVGPKMTDWMAVSDSGEIAIMSSATDYDTRFSDSSVGGTDPAFAHHYRHNQSTATIIKIANSGTHTTSSLAGTWYLTGYFDDFNSSSANGLSGISTGSLVLNATGTGTFSFTDTNNINVSSSNSGNINWTVKQICIGVDASNTRLAYTPTTNCVSNGGRVVDTVEISDPGSGTVFVNMFISSTGKLMTYMDMKGLDSTSAYNHSLGNAVKLP
ncbi:MAG: hypothetical protein OEZ39_19695 [Gammaproteobacteria bacterium]|nr:hypothetical protein [Gammaproteobacteria bacterium]MDH5654091.1 hypothetical protein [Gammaproteobacteria bacterium]